MTHMGHIPCSASAPAMRESATSSQQPGKQTGRVCSVGRALRRWKTACGLTAQDVRIEGDSNSRSTAKRFPMLERLGSETRSPATQGLGVHATRGWRPAHSAEMPRRISARPAKPFPAPAMRGMG